MGAAFPSTLSADSGPFPSTLIAEDTQLTEEEQQKRDDARRLAVVIFVAGGAPSVFAQYSLVWSKQRPKPPKPAAERARAPRKAAMRGSLPSDVQAIVDTRFRASYPEKEVGALWKAVKAAYGSEADARRAVAQNPTILNPAYTSPPSLVGTSKAALVEVLGEQGALELMLQNPAVLQCGRSLRDQPPGQLKSFATLRSLVDQLPAAAPGAVLGTLSLLLLFVLGGKNGALPAEADALVEGVGKLLAVVGIGTTVVGAVLQNVAETGRPRKT